MNTDLIHATLKAISDDLAHWDQDTFSEVTSCGTTMCFGGWALINSGYSLDDKANFLDPSGERLDWTQVEKHARRHLGLTYQQADSIFFWFDSEELDRCATQQERFEAFRRHVLAVTGLADNLGVATMKYELKDEKA